MPYRDFVVAPKQLRNTVFFARQIEQDGICDKGYAFGVDVFAISIVRNTWEDVRKRLEEKTSDASDKVWYK